MSYKKIRDPVYGYIEINENIVNEVIDTATFQRLRNVRQTSYASLYPAALHNRFIHSLGVYHLGKLASKAIYQSVLYHKDNSDKQLLQTLHNLFSEEEWKRYRELFELACLLHDVGHAPFSHTGEDFYSTSKSKVEMIISGKEREGKNSADIADLEKYRCSRHLYQLTKDEIFLDPAKTAEPAPHEIMSAIIAISKFKTLFSDDSERSFLARCITGLIYAEAHERDRADYIEMDADEHDDIKKKGLLNCFIRTLHSTVIDVDRLDYIIRDAATMGYQSVSIDYDRLIHGMIIIPDDDEYNVTLGFHKSAISVIENTVYAHDNQKKWIQGHPTILYEGYLVQQSIIEIEEKLREDYQGAESTFFSYDSLTDNGSNFGDIKIRYLGDEDLLYLMKNVYACKCSEEYLNRGSRCLPIWKSEAEFNRLFGSKERELIFLAMQTIMGGDTAKRGVVVNQNTFAAIDTEITEAQENNQQNKVRNAQEKKLYFRALLEICDSHGIEKNVVLLSTSFFKSNFSKEDVKQLQILFPKIEGKPRRLHEISTMLSSNTLAWVNDGKFVFLYYCPTENRKRVNSKEFAENMVDRFKSIKPLM